MQRLYTILVLFAFLFPAYAPVAAFALEAEDVHVCEVTGKICRHGDACPTMHKKTSAHEGHGAHSGHTGHSMHSGGKAHAPATPSASAPSHCDKKISCDRGSETDAKAPALSMDFIISCSYRPAPMADGLLLSLTEASHTDALALLPERPPRS